MILLPDPIVDPGIAGDFGRNTGRADDLEEAVCFGTHVYLLDVGEEALEVLLVLLRRAKCVYVDFGNGCGRVSGRESGSNRGDEMNCSCLRLLIEVCGRFGEHVLRD